FPSADRLYAVSSANRTAGQLDASVSAVDLDDWRAQRRQIEDLGGYFYAEGSSGVDLAGRGAPRRLSAVFVSPGFFSTLGQTPLAGRLPRDEELVRGGADKILLLTHGFWMREFGGASSVINSRLTIGGASYEVIGVLRPDFRY